MATEKENTKVLQTRIALKYDTYANWTNANSEAGKGKNLVLLRGEIGLCEIPAVDENGHPDATTAPTVLFKVGDGTKPFSELHWVSARAADVYSWAKSETVELIEKTEGTSENPVKKQYLVFKTGNTENKTVDLSTFVTDEDVEALVTSFEGRLSSIEDRLDAVDAFFTAADSDGEDTDSLYDALDTLKEIQEYLSGEEGLAASGLLARITALEDTLKDGGAFETRVADAEDAIEDLNTAVEDITENYLKQADVLIFNCGSATEIVHEQQAQSTEPTE